MDNLLNTLAELFGMKNSPEITEIDIDGAQPLPKGIKQDFLKHCSKGKHALDSYFNIAKNANGDYTFEGAIAYHEQNKLLYLKQDIPASHIHGGIVSKIGSEESFSWEAHGESYSDLASKTEKYVLSENPEKNENGYESVTAKITNKLGLHARAAGTFVKEAVKYKADIYVRNGKDVPLADVEIHGKKYIDGKSIMGLLTLAAGNGSNLEILAKGEDSKKAISGLAEIITNKFYED